MQTILELGRKIRRENNHVFVTTKKRFVEGPPDSLTVEILVLYQILGPDSPPESHEGRRGWSAAVKFRRKPLSGGQARPGVEFAFSRIDSPVLSDFNNEFDLIHLKRINGDEENEQNDVVLHGIEDLLARVSDIAAEREPDINNGFSSSSSSSLCLRVVIRKTVRLTREFVDATRRVRYVGDDGMVALKCGNYKELGDREGLTCAICTELVSDGSSLILVRCSHAFHRDCLLEWMRRNTSCPLCRFRFRIGLVDSH